MSGKKADKPRYWVAYLLKDVEVGTTFKPTLRHLTLIPWFVTDKASHDVIKSFLEQFSGQKSFRVTVGREEEFNNERKIAVDLLNPTQQLQNLHKKTLEWFSFLDARWAVKNPYVGKEYKPHIRRRAGHNLSEGKTLEISSLSLIDANRSGDDLRTVVARADFK